MPVRTAAALAPRFNAFDDLRLTNGENPTSRVNEFTYTKGTEIYGEGEPAVYVYQVKKGAVRSYKLLSDGRRQISEFHLVGDIFGLTSSEYHRFTTEAVIDTTLSLINRESLETRARTDGPVARNLLSMTARDLKHAEDHLLLLGRKDALEKVATFLIEMDKRLTAAGAMTLPMVRNDIADYLGLTVETVSRALSQLHRAGIVSVAGKQSLRREITILDRRQLLSLDLQD